MDEKGSNCNELLLEDERGNDVEPTNNDDDDDEQQGNVVVSVSKYSVAVTHLALAFLNFPRGSRARCAVAI